MTEETKDTLRRLARTIREEVEHLEAKFKEHHNGYPVRQDIVDYKAGKIDGLKQAEKLLGEGE